MSVLSPAQHSGLGGAMDTASNYGSEDPRFESSASRINSSIFFVYRRSNLKEDNGFVRGVTFSREFAAMNGPNYILNPAKCLIHHPVFR